MSGPGGQLREPIKAKELVWATKLNFSQQIATALSGLHAEKNFHGDLRASHVVVERDWSIRIAGFGTPARLNFIKTRKDKGDEGRRDEEMRGRRPVRMADFTHFAPESLQPHGKVNAKSDVYALGVLLWEICNQEKAYDGLSRAEIAERVVAGARLPVDGPKMKDVPAEFIAIMKDCWNAVPEQRPDMQEVKRRLNALTAS